MEENDTLSMDTPMMPHKYANVVVVGDSVVLVRHHFAEAGDVNQIYMEYLNDKITNNSI